MTKAEVTLWRHLRRDGLGVSFRKQHPMGPYFIDFYCASLKLAVELDGSQHFQQQAYDARRTAFLNENGVAVLRFWNNEVMESIDGVGLAILDAIRRRKVELGI